ncbi:MAG TPA: CaiB/BaiF CoA-transferase family protein [Acidimicrobiales bacterium]|jgi:crotonobetainyl-CoA:carnitine CoA-transferase CaiB-like acyl-CoA transferase|nr:CaiB/BaiF CoA-transferase family protein [Acidimicrobiales bacterium]
MRLGDTANEGARGFGRPLDGIRVIALEQMQALPFATQLMARMGAEIIKVEEVGRGDSGRTATPTLTRENGEKVGATFLRNNLGKESVAIDFQSDRGRQLVLDLSQKADIVCENLGPGKAKRLGLDYETMSADHPELIYLSISGFGNDGLSPYEKWPAYASVAEAMSGIYEYSRRPHQPPVINPVGGLGDTGSGMFGVIGVLAALRHRDATGLGQHVDVSMFDSMVAICDLAVNYWSMGQFREPDQEFDLPLILDSFQSAGGWFIVQIVRDHQFERLANLVGHPEWVSDERFATRQGWRDHLEPVIRPAVEAWAADKTNLDAARMFAESGIAAAPCSSAADVAQDPHVALHNMLVELERTDGVDQPVLVAGNPIKMSKVAEGPEKFVPMMGEHTASVLASVLGLDDAAIGELVSSGVISTVEKAPPAGTTDKGGKP